MPNVMSWVDSKARHLISGNKNEQTCIYNFVLTSVDARINPDGYLSEEEEVPCILGLYLNKKPQECPCDVMDSMTLK